MIIDPTIEVGEEVEVKEEFMAEDVVGEEVEVEDVVEEEVVEEVEEEDVEEDEDVEEVEEVISIAIITIFQNIDLENMTLWISTS